MIYSINLVFTIDNIAFHKERKHFFIVLVFEVKESELLAVYEYMRQQTRAASNDTRLLLPEYIETKSERARLDD